MNQEAQEISVVTKSGNDHKYFVQKPLVAYSLGFLHVKRKIQTLRHII